MSVEEVCRKYNTDCVQVKMGGARAGVGALGLREEGWRLVCSEDLRVLWF